MAASLIPSLCTKIALAQLNKSRGLSITCLRPKQIECLMGLLSGHDVVAILPTGYGKSLIFELIPLAFEALQLSSTTDRQTECSVIVFSPLNSIINEQADRYGRDALIVKGQSNDMWKDLATEHYKYILGHPEHLLEKHALDVFGSTKWQERNVFIVVDEAHCVVKWGPSFRPSFKDIYKLKAIFPGAKQLALTATATTDLQKELVSALHMHDPLVVSASIDRPNIKLTVKQRPSSTGKNTVEESYEFVFIPVISALKQMKDKFPKTIIYSGLKWCGHGHELAVRQEIDGSPSVVTHLVAQFHKPCTNQMKLDVGAAIQDGGIRLLFASEAYSMGTDVPDIEQIIHASPPHCLETYLQEVGRAGRDGRVAEAVLYYNASDISTSVVSMSPHMREFCLSDSCRRKFLCEKFDCSIIGTDFLHLCCDVCEKECICDACSPSKDSITCQGLKCVNDLSFIREKMLLTYFRQENRVASEPTGLTWMHAHELAVNHQQFSCAEDVRVHFQIKHSYATNIWAILTSF